jgi:hypothetical protein
MAKAKTPLNKTASKKTNNTFMVFKKQNYILLLLSILVIVIGFMIMGSGKDLPFDHPRKITIAPLVILLGFAIGVVSILYTPKEDSPKEEE